MQDEKPSATAWRVALARAAHQFFDTPRVFDDPLALRIVGAYSQGRNPETFFHDRYKPTRRSTFVRALVAVRSRLAEDELEAALEYIEDDELVEITPTSIRFRKILLKESDRKKAARRGD